jgi:pimeloyl-ACP methyl ester carboxylesterase
MESLSGFTHINGADLYYEVKGDGQPLLLIHAGVADGRMWDDQFEVFAEKYRVIRFDLRGFGRSNIPPGQFSNIADVKALLDFLSIEETYLLGISFGGLTALDFTLAHPEIVKALILGAPSVSGSAPSQRIKDFWEEEETAEANGDLEGATDINVRVWVDGPHREADEVDPAVREKVYQMQLNIFQKDFPDDLTEIELEPPANGRLAELNLPIQVMVGDLDLEEKVDLAHRLVGEIPNSKLVIIPGVAHMLNMEKPELFNQYVLDFLSKV